ncbi:MAG: histidine--tRNA ligase [Chitinophagaceae bacterium]|nr:histidine--tRNA ligase [Chitinophagaceae bacterium]
MAKVTVSVPQGTRDFGPEVVRKRSYIFSVIRSVFERYGFQPLETPAMENLETLMGKYGDEGDKLIFKILNNGLERPEKREKTLAAFEQVLAGRNNKDITERALRYDLTIPFARYVAMNHAQLSFPFKRYQMQPVWRADKPQKGRYREFYQCDADVVGSQSLLNEVELTAIYAQAFEALGIPVSIRINSRKFLASLANRCGGPEKLIDITVAIDKLDKIGLEKVKEELVQKGLTGDQIATIEAYLLISGSNAEKLQQLRAITGNEDTGLAGIAELEYVLDWSDADTASKVEIDLTLARGLNYYTGIIFEVKALGVSMGSIGGGGRYDDLTGLFGVTGIPGVGVSFGIDRIYDVMEELQLFPATVHTGTEVLFFNLGEAESKKALDLAQRLRHKEIRCELYHEVAKFDKQFKYAERKQIPYIVIIGSQELENGSCNVKDIRTGVQQTLSFDELLLYTFS